MNTDGANLVAAMQAAGQVAPLSQAGLVALLLLGLGLFFVLAEAALPTHGVLGVLGFSCMLGGVAACFVINAWLGVGIFLGLVILAPFAGAAFVKIWPRTPIGRRMVLGEVVGHMPATHVQVGATGVTISELRPMGECEFEDVRVEAISEHGMIAPGARVRVVALSDHRPVVQTMEAT